MIQDVSYWVNYYLKIYTRNYVCINAAIEESTVSDRNTDLMDQDKFVRDHLQTGDVVIASLGGNDIALKPTLATIVSIGALNYITPSFCVEAGWGPGFGHLSSIFKSGVENILERIFETSKPALCIPSTIYYPAESGAKESWANPLFEKLGYNEDTPEKLQCLIDACYKYMTLQITLDGVTVSPLALSNVLDSKDPQDYDNRVEPSITGGKKMGRAYVERILLCLR